MPTTNKVESFLTKNAITPPDSIEQSGVKGMRWGVRRSGGGGGGGSSDAEKVAKRSGGVKTSRFKKAKESSEDSKAAHDILTQVKKKGLSSLSNDQINKVNARIQLEQKFSQLNPKQKSLGRKLLDHAIKAVSNIPQEKKEQYVKAGISFLFGAAAKAAGATPREAAAATAAAGAAGTRATNNFRKGPKPPSAPVRATMKLIGGGKKTTPLVSRDSASSKTHTTQTPKASPKGRKITPLAPRRK
jgi:hypothetical protein